MKPLLKSWKVEEINLPSSFAMTIPRMNWPGEVYAGRLIAGFDERVIVNELPQVPRGW